MDKERETNLQQIPSLIPNHNNNNNVTTTITLKEESPRKPISGGGGGGGGDRLKRDEWSEGAVSSLLEAYESKWVLRNRAKLKGHDWEDVARYVSSRANCTKSPKTQTQCKNKIESMKKRYRSESTADASSWPLYSRLDLLLRGNGPPPAVTITQAPPVVLPPPPPTLVPASTINSPLLLLDPSPVGVAPPAPPPTAAPPPPPPPQNSNGSNGVDRMAKEDGGMNKVISEHGISDKNSMDTDSSTPALYSDEKEKMRSRKPSKKTKMMEKMKKKRKRSSSSSSKEEYEIAESIRWLAEVVVKSEQARMETMREIERIRVEAEAKRAEMDLKRTEIIANTQLEIARLFATSGGVAGKPVDSSLRIGRN